jgi:hypothetical protein
MNDMPTPAETELVELVRSIDVPAPPALHARVEKLVAERSSPAGIRRRHAGGPLAWGAGALAAAACAAVLVLALSGGSSSNVPDVRSASALALRPATMGAPAESHSHSGQLTAAVDGVAFPYWEERFGWRTAGARADHIAGRPVMTVFYANGRGQRIGYSIVGGTPPAPLGGSASWRRGTAYHLLSVGSAYAIAWLRSGHLCIVSGHGVKPATLLRLASWSERSTPA